MCLQKPWKPTVAGQNRQGHVQEVLSYLGFRRFQPDDQAALQAWLLERALEHDKPTLLLHMACEHLKQQQLMRPGVTILERLVVSARIQAHHESFRRLHPLLSQTVMDFLDSLLALEPDSGRTTLYTLRQHATTNTPAALVRALDKRALLQQWDIDQWDLTSSTPIVRSSWPASDASIRRKPYDGWGQNVAIPSWWRF